MGRVLAVAAIVCALAGCSKAPVVGSLRLDPALAGLVPEDTLFIMGADVDGIKNTSVYQKHIGIIELPRLNEFTKQTGVDPRKDLSQVLSMSNGKTGVFMAKGLFKASELEGRLRQQGVKSFDYKGHQFFGDDRTAIVFVKSDTAVAGSTAALKPIVDAGSRSSGLPKVLAERLKTVPAGSQIWVGFAGGTQGLDFNAPENSNLAMVIRLLKGIESAALGMDIRNGFDLGGEATCGTEDHAKQLRSALKGIVGLGRLSTPDSQPDLLKIYDAIQVDQAQTKVTVSAHVPLELADRFVDLWLKRR